MSQLRIAGALCAGLPEGAAAAAGIDPQRLLSMQQLEVQVGREVRLWWSLVSLAVPHSLVPGSLS